MLNEALEYAARGWAVFPVEPRGKRPLTIHGVKDATSDPTQVEWEWERWPDANIGLATGASGLVVIDIDKRESATLLPSVPRTLTQRTGSGGWHLFFTAPEWPLGPTVGKLPGVGATPGIDLRAGDSYVILPPSIHPSGQPYRWADQLPVAACPKWLKPEPPKPREQREIKDGSRYAKGALASAVKNITDALDGTRNHTLNAEAFSIKRFIEAGELDYDQAREALEVAAEQAGLNSREIAATLRSALG